MLNLFSNGDSHDCSGMTRRDFVRVGSLGLCGLSLADVLRTRAAAAGSRRSFVRDKAVVLLYLSGGASHIETFDPKPTAALGVRSTTGSVATTIPGESFGGTFPGLAQRADQLAVVRAFTHDVGGHVQAHVHLLTGGIDPIGDAKTGFSMGSAYARMRGANHETSGLPTYTLLTAEEVDSQYRNERGRVVKGSHPGPLGAAFAPFQPNGDGPARRNMTLNLAEDRLHSRRQLLREIDTFRRQADGSGLMTGIDQFNAQAIDLVLGGAARAFDVDQEDPALIERYDTSAMQIGFKKFRPSTLGRQMLLARRLVENGCGFVTIHSAGWDMHADGNNPGIVSGMEMLGRTVDKALSAFLDDLADRGLSDKVLLVVTGDFGRTPKVNRRGGRDHWTRLATLAFAGGGLNMGQIVGQSARNADVPASDPIGPTHLFGTVMHTLFDVGELRLISGLPTEVLQAVERHEPIRELF